MISQEWDLAQCNDWSPAEQKVYLGLKGNTSDWEKLTKENFPFFDTLEDHIWIHMARFANVTSTPQLIDSTYGAEPLEYDLISSKYWIWSHLLGAYLGEKIIFYEKINDRAWYVYMLR